ncbi:MAG: BNR-4 repeat-containing protein [Candidatus Hydrogenedentota bacterium]
MRKWLAGAVVLNALILGVVNWAHASNVGEHHFAWDSIGGTLARDHQSRAMYYEGEHRRTYVVYMDHSFFARITYYDHDEKTWVYPAVLLDDCIRPDDRFHHAYKDGHNVPNLFITRDGTVHIFYGAHGTVFRYARTKNPEDIKPGNWDVDMRVGSEGTYPFFSQTRDGTLHVFYRYSPTGGYKNPFLGLQTKVDNGTTWSEIKKLATFPDACKLYRGAYDPVEDRIHLLIHPRGPLGGRPGAVHCIYEPESEKLLSLSEVVLGPMGTVETFQKGLPKIFHGTVDFVLHEGTPYFLYEDKESRYHFGYWRDGAWVDFPDSEDKLDGLAQRPALYTTDGKTFRVYGIADWDVEREELYGGDVCMWESADGGKTWSEGKVIADRRKFGHGFQQINKVMNYSGTGPFLIASEPTGPWPEGWEKTQFTHYDNPSRRDKRLYAFDVDGNLISR